MDDSFDTFNKKHDFVTDLLADVCPPEADVAVVCPPEATFSMNSTASS